MDENADGGVVTSVATENATSVTVSDERFEVADGNLKLAAGTTLDFESDSSPIEVTITASGDGDSATHTVSVSINDVNEGPSISVADGTTPDGMAAASTINENAAGVPVGEITLSDPDAGDTHTLAVSDDRFETSQDSAGGWWLKLKDGESLDHEEAGSVTVTVTVTDAGGLSASADVTVTVSNVDEAPSAPMVRDAALSVDENDAGATLSSLSDSTDPEGDAVTYAVDDDRFEITSGLILKLKDGESLDHEEAGSVDIMLTAMDPAGNVSEATVVTITVNDVNEAPTVMAADHAVDENEAGVALGAITASDPDGDTLTVEVSGGGDRFEARQDAEGGWWVALKDGESLDHETEESVTVMVTVTDAAGLSATTEATVTVNDVNETFMLEAADGAVDENAEGAVVGAVAATGDPDDGDTHTFMVEDDDRFEVKDGMLKLMDDESLNHETEETVTVMVTATDSGGNTQQASVTVTVNDVNEDPTFARSEYAFNLSENAAGPVGVGMVSATDVDDDTLEYSITGGNDDGLFAIDSASGAISYVGTGEDYRSSVTGPSHTLTVAVSDGGDGDPVEATVGITILNANDAPMFGASNYAFDLAENDDGSTTAVDVGMVSASDSDEGDAVTYSITGGNDDGLFAIDAATGAITYVGSGEDAETTASHALTVSASDGSASSEAMVTVTVTNANDSTPAFGEDSYAFDLAENANGSATAVAVGMVSATDSDGDTLSYSITAGNDDNLFAIDAASGAITYEGAGENYESGATSHELTVSASDGTNSDSATVTVTVTDVNDAPMADADMMIDTLALVSGTAGSMDVDLGALFMDQDGDSLTFSIAEAPEWLSLSVTRSGDDITGSIGGTPPDDGNNLDPAMVKIVATDPGGATGEATFYVVVDAVNAAPSSVTLRQTDDGVTSVVTAVTVAENAMGAGFGTVTVEDVDNAMHPHGQHMYTFEVDGVANEKLFEVKDGMLKLKADQALSYEDYTDGTFTLTVTATDGAEGDAAGSASMTLEVTLTNTADGPVANEIGDWWVTVDDRLDAEDAREGEWLSFVLRTTGEDAAFTDEDSDTLTYSIAVADASGNAVDWLQINANTGAMTNVAGTIPEAGVYTVTVTATDEDDNSASASFNLAVAVGDLDNSDNDRPDIRDVVDYDYTEGSGAARVASFEVRDDDIAIAPHLYGTLEVEFTAMQGTVDVSDRFKLVEMGNDGNNTAQYEIHHKSADELFEYEKNDDGMYVRKLDAKGNPIPIDPIDYEKGDEVAFTVTATDGQGEMDDQTVRVDIEDAADTAPVFKKPSGSTRIVKDMKGTTTFEVDQQESDEEVFVLQLNGQGGVWDDPDTDVDELDFSIGSKAGLPDWIKVYGPDQWEDIYTRRDSIVESDSSARDRDMVVAIVIDRTAATGNNEEAGKALASFTVTATDPDGNATTETISIDVKNINVDITENSKKPVLEIEGDPNGVGELTMDFDAAQDPDLDSADDATLVLYTWTHDNATPDDDTDDVTTISTSPQPFVLDADGDMANDHIGRQITATVKYYEVDPANGQIVASGEYTDTTKTIRAPEPGEGSTARASFDLTTDDTGLAVALTVSGADLSGATVVIESSTDGQEGNWQIAYRPTVTAIDTSTTPGSSIFDIDSQALDADKDSTTANDGGGLHYRVVVTHGTGADRVSFTSDSIQLGTLSDPDGSVTVTDINGLNADGEASVGQTIQVNTDGDPADVQWQVSNNRGGFDDIEGATGRSLEVTSKYAGKMLRAKVAYTATDNSNTPADETGWVTWVEYTEIGTVPGGGNGAPAATQALSNVKEIEVELPAMKKVGTGTAAMDVQPGKVEMGTAKDLFHDPDGDPLTYSIEIPDASSTGEAANTGFTSVAVDTSAAGNTGNREAVLGGNLVYVTYETESVADPDNAGSFIAQDVGEPQQTLAIDKNTGEITYLTNMSHGHDGNDADGQGNMLTFTVSATDNRPGSTAAEASVAVRINVAPTGIRYEISDATDGLPAVIDNDPTSSDVSSLLPLVGAKSGTPAKQTAVPLVVGTDDDGSDGLTSGDSWSTTFVDDQQYDEQVVARLNVQDENATDNGFGTHMLVLTGKGKDMFELTDAGDTDGSTWNLQLKDGARFDFDALAPTMAEKTAGEMTFNITVTATDGGGLMTTGVFSVTVMNDTSDDPEPAERPTPSDPKEPETPGLKDDSDDSDQDGPVPPPEGEGPEMPGDGGMFIDDLIDLHVENDLLGDYMLAIDDIDVA